MTDCEANGYQQAANMIELQLKNEGYLSSEISTIAFYLLRDNIEESDEFQPLNNEVNELLESVDTLIRNS